MEGGEAVTVQYTGHVGRGLRHVMVDHHFVGDGLPLPLLVGPGPEPLGDMGLVVSASPETLLLGIGGRRLQEDQSRLRAKLPNTASTLQIDLEEDIVTCLGLTDGRPVEVTQVLGPLEETSGLDAGLEGGAVDEDIRVLGLARTSAPGGPRSAEPQTRVRGDQLPCDRALADSTRPEQYERQGRVPDRCPTFLDATDLTRSRSAGGLAQQSLALVAAQTLEPAALADAHGVHQPAGLDLAKARK